MADLYIARNSGGEKKIDISSATITLANGTLTYDGTLKTQGVQSVMVNGTTLVKNTDYTVINNAYINAGNYTLTIIGMGAYEGTKSANWSIAKAQGSISVNPSTLTIQGVNETDTSTVSYIGDGALSVSSNDSSVTTATINGTTVTITSVAGGDATISVVLSEGNNYLDATASIAVTVSVMHIYGVSWDKSASSALSRTDDSALFTDPVPALSGGSGSSPFDNRLPWSGMVRETISGNEMVKIPKFWFKWTDESGSLKLQIADNAIDGFHVSPAHADRGDGEGERDHVYIGRYHCASDYKSKTGVKPIVSITRATARSGCKGLGTGFYQLDYAMWWTVRMLYLVEFADWNSQAKIGYGCGDNSATHNSGASDSAQYHTGSMQSSRTTYGKGIQYRYIEDPWGNVRDWCDGVVLSNGAPYVCKNPANYGDSTSNHTKVGNAPSGSGNCISGWTVPTTSGLEWALWHSNVVSNSNYDTYCADNGTASTSSTSNLVVYVGGYYYQSQYVGMFNVGSYTASSTYAYIGARLQYLP